jgi:hypothetical protein
MPLSPDHADKGDVPALLPQRSAPMTPEPARDQALTEAPGKAVVMLRPAPVKVRAMTCLAVAYTVTHVLVEWYDAGRYHVRWEAAWLVRKL